MSTIIGQVSTIKGCVRAIAPVTGRIRILEKGSPVFAGEMIITSAVGGILMTLENGVQLTLSRDTQMRLDHDVISQASTIDSGTEGAVDIEALQQALLEGGFNTLEETAAGEKATQEATREVIQETTKESGMVVESIGTETEVTSRFDSNLAQVQILDTKERVGTVAEPIALESIVPAPIATKAIVASLALSSQSDMPEDAQITYGPIADAAATEDNNEERATAEADQLDESLLHDRADDNLFMIENETDELSATSINKSYSINVPLDLSEVIDLEAEVDEAILAQYLDFGFDFVGVGADNAATAGDDSNLYRRDNNDLNIDYQND